MPYSETITSVEQVGHDNGMAFFVRTDKTPGGGWVDQNDSRLFAVACALRAAQQMGGLGKVAATLFYETHDPNVPKFNNVSRIFMS